MKKEIFINESMGETRIAIQEDGQIVEVYIERQDKQRMVGNIYKGKVENVLPGMQAAFVDIGYELNAFLPFSEIANPDYIIEDDADGNQKKKGKPASDVFFDNIKNFIKKDPKAIKADSGIFQFNITGPNPVTWSVDLSKQPGTLRRGTGG